MSFEDDLLDLLEADLRTALSLTGEQVYRGERPREPTRAQGLEVWIKPRPVRSQLGGMGGIVSHPFEIHLRYKALNEGIGTGGSKGDTLAGHEETVRRRYDGGRNFYAGLSDLVCLAVTDGSQPGDEDLETMDRFVELVALERC